ncbi:PDZD8 (predicted) [Pycnogonum litorale]
MFVFAAIVFTFVIGMMSMLLLQWTLMKFVFTEENTCPNRKPQSTRIVIPDELKELLEGDGYKNQTESWLSINIIAQFVFKEWKDNIAVRRWCIKKITSEFEHFLQSSTLGKFLDNITIKDMSFGNKLPVFKNIKVTNVSLDPLRGHIEEVDIEMTLDYSGGFQLHIEADTVLGKSAALSVKVVKLEGTGRLQLTRDPYSHWSFAFLEPPETQFDVKSQLIPQATSLIISQIRRVLRKRHTVPFYKIRYKPFCQSPDMRQPLPSESDDIRLHGSRLSNGYLSVNVVECSRLIETPANSMIYCTLAIDSSAWIELVLSESVSWTTQDVDITKSATHSIGILLKQEFILDKYDHCVIVETITPNSPASNTDIKKNDVVISIGGVRVTTVDHAVKLFKHAGDKFVIRIERKSNLKVSHSQELLIKETKVNEEIFSLKDDEISIGEDDEEFISYTFKEGTSESGNRKQPMSLHKQLFHRKHQEGISSPKFSKKNLASSNDSSTKTYDEKSKRSSSLSGSQPASSSMEYDSQSLGSYGTDSEKSGPDSCSVQGSNVDLKKTTPLKSSRDLIWEEIFEFQLTEKHRYLNIGVWYKTPERKQDRFYYRPERDVLIGHTSVNLSEVTLECAMTLDGTYEQNISLMPPEPKTSASRDHKLSSFPGFNRKMCYGDITLAFIHRPESDECENVDSDFEEETEKIEDVQLNTSDIDGHHDFIEAHFHASTICDFCHKKIWLKTAFQCRKCAMICHKKCVHKCHVDTICTPTSVDGNPPVQVTLSPLDVVTTMVSTDELTPGTLVVCTPNSKEPFLNVIEASFDFETVQQQQEVPKRKKSLSNLLSNLTSSKKQSGSTQDLTTVSVSANNSLAPPSIEVLFSGSRSLPGSPHHSPRSSRKCSLQENPFSSIHGLEANENIETAIERVLQHHPQDEMLVSAAKELGKELYSNLSVAERKLKLNAMISKLQSEISSEDTKRAELYARDKETTDLAMKTKIALLVGQSDEKTQALGVIMFHYIAGLRNCLEAEQAEQLQPSEDEVDNSLKLSSDCDQE